MARSCDDLGACPSITLDSPAPVPGNEFPLRPGTGIPIRRGSNRRGMAWLEQKELPKKPAKAGSRSPGKNSWRQWPIRSGSTANVQHKRRRTTKPQRATTEGNQMTMVDPEVAISLPEPNEHGVVSWDDAVAESEFIEYTDNGQEGETSNDDAPAGSPICPTCGDPIILAPGHTGRKPKYHPGHRPSDSKGGGIKAPRTPRKSSRNKAEKEADDIAAQVRKGLAMAALGVSMYDPFDGYAIFAGSDQVVKGSSKVLAKHEKWRIMLMETDGGTGWISLVMGLLCIAVPIAAHHGIIPKELKTGNAAKPIPIGQWLETIPDMLTNLQKKLDNAESELARQVREAANAADDDA